MKSVAILGLGLMGGSLGLALKKARPSILVQGSTRSRERGELARQRGAIDAYFEDPRDAVRDADVVVCCAPILAIPDQVRAIAAHLKPGAVVTDVGSTKEYIQRACRAIISAHGSFFVGSHPIAGSEQQGMEAAREDLYRNAVVVLTPDETADSGAVETVRALWVLSGAVVTLMAPEEHDRVLASTSHLPHLIASLLAATVGRAGHRPDLPQYCGAGYRDTTRIATGGTDIWMDIVKSNRAALTIELKAFADKLGVMIEKLEHQSYSDIQALLEEGKNARQAFTTYGHQSNSEE